MPAKYKPQKHIQSLAVTPRSDGLLDQREITIQSYQTTVPFDYEALSAKLEKAWLTPHIRFGLFSRLPLPGVDEISVVLGLQDDLSVRAYDYDKRRPLWFSWQNVIVDTVSIRYSRDEAGFVKFTTSGGGQRITDDRLHDFNAVFLDIPADATVRQQFDLTRLRELCFERFINRLYMIKFCDPSGEEYKSIDHALFKSRKYIDPNAARFLEVHADKDVTIESFDSDIDLHAQPLIGPAHVRFFLQGLSGSLRLRIPKLNYKEQPVTPQGQAKVFYQLIDLAVRSILDADYYTHQPRSLDDLDKDLGLFVDRVDLSPFREVLTSVEARSQFFNEMPLELGWPMWQPHLRALDEMVGAAAVYNHVSSLCGELATGSPMKATGLLSACQADVKARRLGAVVASAVADRSQDVPSASRAHVEDAVLSWVIDHEETSWDIDPGAGEVSVLSLHWQLEDLSLEAIGAVVWKLLKVFHDRLLVAANNPEILLEKYAWCVNAARGLSPSDFHAPAAMRLIASGRTPKTVADAGAIFKASVDDLRSLDDACLAEFGLPLWPQLNANRTKDGVALSNMGNGAAIAVIARPAGELFADKDSPASFDLLADSVVCIPAAPGVTALDIEFQKFGRAYAMTLPITGESLLADQFSVKNRPAAVINHKRLSVQRAFRSAIDAQGMVVGSSPSLLKVFEDIHFTNAMDDCMAVLLLGEPGVGKTHIAELLHRSSKRASHAFKAVNAGGGGGDINIQRGEWIGYGKGHGISGVDPKGRPGHLMNADRGTLFVDEFATLSPDLQVIFLSVLEGRAVEKIGGESITPDVRCIFATNADIDGEVAAGRLRRDLVDRVTTTIRIPPLRERPCDVLLLARHFAANHTITDHCLLALVRHSWPGNVREVKGVLSRAVAKVTSEDSATIDLQHTDLPVDCVASVDGLDANSCKRDLWLMADKASRDEGYSHGNGLQRRAGEIMGVGEPQASKMYRAYGLSGSVSA